MKKVITSCLTLILVSIPLWAQITVSKSLEVTEEMLSAEAVYLRMEDVDTFCDVRVNGNLVGSTSNRFRRWEWDVKPFLHEGENVLEGTFHDAETISEQLNDALDHVVRMNSAGLVPHLNLIRKPIYQGAWDWVLRREASPTSSSAAEGPSRSCG